jgi:hypothetical protein
MSGDAAMTVHRLVAVAWHGETGAWRARCSCRWTSGKYLAIQMARAAWMAHVRRQLIP